MSAEPYLTVVAASRNDDHGGDMLRRMQVFVDALAAQCERHGADVELILVEWNPPADRPPLLDVLAWPAAGGRLQVRIVQVPPRLHDTIENADRLAFFQMIAKNVGIRRARAPFVLATNIDLVFPDELMEIVAQHGLEAGSFYRTDRHDVELAGPVPAAVDGLLSACRASVIRICTRRGTRDLRTGEWFPIYTGIRDIPGLLAARLRVRGERVARVAGRVLLLGLRPRRSEAAWAWAALSAPARAAAARTRAVRGPREAVWLVVGPFARRARHVLNLLRRVGVRLHTNACGDFTLLARDDWARLRGYPELPIFSMHIDSLLLYQAHFAGMREVELPYAVFHLEHEKGFKPDSEGLRKMNDWVGRAGIPQITSERFGDWVVEMKQRRGPLQFNDVGWGFGDAELPEHAFVL